MEDLLPACDVLITGTSVTTFQAILHKKPVIIFNPYKRYYPYPFLNQKAAVETGSVSELAVALDQIARGGEAVAVMKKGREETLKQYVPPAGQLTQKAIAELIVSFESSKSRPLSLNGSANPEYFGK